MMPIEAAAEIALQPKKSSPKIAASPSAPKSAKKMPNCAAAPRSADFGLAIAHENHDREDARVDAELEEVVEEVARLDDAALHHRHAARKERDDAVMHHRWSRHAGQGAVGEQSAKANRQEEKRLEALHDREIQEDQADRNHDELADAIRKPAQHLDLVPLHERTRVVEVAADPVAVLVIVAVAVRAKRLLRRTVRLVEVTRQVRGRRLLQKAGNARVVAKTGRLVEGLLPWRLLAAGVGEGRKRARRESKSQKKFFHINS